MKFKIEIKVSVLTDNGQEASEVSLNIHRGQGQGRPEYKPMLTLAQGTFSPLDGEKEAEAFSERCSAAIRARQIVDALDDGSAEIAEIILKIPPCPF